MLEKSNSKSNLTNPLLSVIIPCYAVDRLNDIINLIYSIRAQTYSNIEVIIVSDSLSLYDKLSWWLTKSNYPPIRLLHNRGEKSTSSAKNLGIFHAKGEIISFIDDDVVLLPNWAEEVVKTFGEDDSVIGITGSALPMWESEPPTWFPDEFSWILGSTAWCDLTGMRDIGNVWGMNMAFRREAFDQSGLFQTKLGMLGDFRKCWQKVQSDENEFSLRVRDKTGKRIVYNPKVRVKHKVHKYRLTLSYIAKKSYNVGLSRAMWKKLYPKDTCITTSPTGESRLLKRIFLKLFPEIFRLLFKHPSIAMRKLLVTFIVLSCATVGYCFYPKGFFTIIAATVGRYVE